MAHVPLIGLTGSIASGKSTVAGMLRALGATVVDADTLARQAVAPGTPALAAIRDRWGPGVLAPDGSLDRAALRRIVFADPGERSALEAVVHPEVERRRQVEVAAARAAGAPLIVCDIPLLFEKEMAHRFDLVVFVDASDDVRLQRLVRHRRLPAAEAGAMLAAQMPNAEKRRRADVVVPNDGDLESLRSAVVALWPRLLAARPRDPGR